MGATAASLDNDLYTSYISKLDYHLSYLTCDMCIYIIDVIEMPYNISKGLIAWDTVNVP